MMLKCVVIDDEPLARQLLIDYCDRVPFVEVVRDFSTGITALEYLNHNLVDFIFLDIKMPDLSGLDLASVLKKDVKIIFTTAFVEHAIDGFELDAVDYLLKPFDFPRFLKAVSKVKNRGNSKEEISSAKSSGHLFAKDGRSLVKLRYDEIKYVQGQKDYVKFVATDKMVMSLMNMRDLERELPSDLFIRIHQSYIINSEYIELVANDKVKIGEEFLPVSLTYKRHFKAFLSTGDSNT